MGEQEEKRVIIRLAYNYFQSKKWDRALEEYLKLIAIDPMDFSVHNMMAEIYIRKGEKDMAMQSFIKAANLLRATNNFDKAIQAYNHILKLDPENAEAKGRLEEVVKSRLLEVDDFIRRKSLKSALAVCERLAERLPDHPLVQERLQAIQLRMESGGVGMETEPAPGFQAESGDDEGIHREEIVKNLYALAQRFERKESWEEAVEAYITILRYQPEDERARTSLRDLYRKITRQDQAADVWARIRSESQGRLDTAKQLAKTAAAPPESAPREESGEASPSALERPNPDMDKLRQAAEVRLQQSLENRRGREKQKKDAEPAAAADGATEDPDLRALLAQTQMYIRQNLLVEAMRLCQRILELDPQNKEVRVMLKQIYDKKNL